MSKHTQRLVVIAGVTAIAAIAVMFVPRIPQPTDYHNFADQRAWFGVPNFLNVASNLPFLFVGLWGLRLTLKHAGDGRVAFTSPLERWPYAILAAGVVLTFFGSSYYHLAPDNARLVWDRLPMTIGFMSLLAAMLMERVGVRGGLIALLPLLLLGAASVLYWYATELRGAGDLRLYLMVQFYTLVLVLLILWLFPARYTRGSDLVIAMGFYVLAKVLEILDRPIYRLGGIVSGHTLKHLAAAIGIYWIFRMVARRRPILDSADV
jgi:hypothetical protein